MKTFTITQEQIATIDRLLGDVPIKLGPSVVQPIGQILNDILKSPTPEPTKETAVDN